MLREVQLAQFSFFNFLFAKKKPSLFVYWVKVS